MFWILRADANGFVEVERPKCEEFVMPANGSRVAEAIGPGGHVLVFASHHRPELPSVQLFSMAKVEERQQVVVCDKTSSARLSVERKKKGSLCWILHPPKNSPSNR